VSKIIIYTDGASKGNPGPGGWGAIVASESEVRELGGHEEYTTNNRMELTAVHQALEYARAFQDADVVVYTDSSYVISGATLWRKGWKYRGWVTKDKKPVLNRDLWEPFLNLVDSFRSRLTWHNVGGHIGVVGNERADEIADGIALGRPVDLYDGTRAAYAVDIDDLSHDVKKKEARSAARSRSKQKAHSYVSAVNGNVQVHKTWAECEKRVRGKKARFKKALSAADEAEIIRRFST